MYNRYKLINFRPDPFLETTFTIGAVVESDKSVEIVWSKKLPPASYIGEQENNLLELLIDRIKRTEWVSVNQIPKSYGQHIIYSLVRDIPVSATKTVNWVDNFVLNRQEV